MLRNRKKNQNLKLELKKDCKPSDDEMIELIEEIKDNFNIKNLSWDHNDLYDKDKKYDYTINGIKIYFRYDNTYSTQLIRLSINNKEITISMISNYLFENLAKFLFDKEEEERKAKNTSIFAQVLPSHIAAKNFNL